MLTTDLIIIGAGPGGYETALLAARRGLSVALIERGEVGGTCLNEGCIPTKALCRTAAMVSDFAEAEAFGIKDVAFTLDFPAVMERKRAVVKQLRDGVESLISNPNHPSAPRRGSFCRRADGRGCRRTRHGERRDHRHRFVVGDAANRRQYA